MHMELDEELGGETIRRVEYGMDRGRQWLFEVGTKQGVCCWRQRWNLLLPIPFFRFTVLLQILNHMLPYDWNELRVNTRFYKFPPDFTGVEHRSECHFSSNSCQSSWDFPKLKNSFRELVVGANSGSNPNQLRATWGWLGPKHNRISKFKLIIT